MVHLAAELGCTSSAVAIAWVLTRPGVDAALVGARNADQLDDSLAAATISLPAEAVDGR